MNKVAVHSHILKHPVEQPMSTVDCVVARMDAATSSSELKDPICADLKHRCFQAIQAVFAAAVAQRLIPSTLASDLPRIRRP
jgi:hypothetical protein